MPNAYFLTGPNRLERREYAIPPLRPRDVLLKSVLSGISHGTEMNLYRATAPFAEKHFDGEHRLFMPNKDAAFRPMRLGYEMVSRVVKAGNEVAEVKVGDLVHTATPHQPTTVVDMDKDATAQIPMQVLPPGVTPGQAVFGALIGVALAASHDAQIKIGDQVTIFGMGTIGLLSVQLARLSGALHIVAVDPIAKRREMAAELGADEVIDPNVQDPGETLKFREHGPTGADVVIEASGHYEALQAALRCAHMGGTVVTLGYYQGGGTPLQLGEEWHHNRLNMVSSMGVWQCPSRYYPMWDRRRVSRSAFELLQRGLIEVEMLITQRFPYEEAPAAYKYIDEHAEETVKVALTYE